MVVPVILSGGSGSRLWPLSRQQFPKQFLALAGERSLFQQTLDRLAAIAAQAPIVICSEAHRFIVAEQLAGVRATAHAILLEPFGRNTAPAVATAALRLLAEGRDELMLVLPADHLIDDLDAFASALETARQAADRGALVLFGIPASRAETGFGYIRGGPPAGHLPSGARPVRQFVEKPDLEHAEAFVASGDYLWNSGMFLFRASQYLAELQRHAPEIHAACRQALAGSENDLAFVRIDAAAFAHCPARSVDHAVLEHTERACVVALNSAWSDIGSWSALWQSLPADPSGNVVQGDVLLDDSRNCLVHSSDRLVAVAGVEDLVVVETRDAVLVAHRDQAQAIRRLVERLNAQGRSEGQRHDRVFRPWGSYDTLHAGPGFQVKHLVVKAGASLSLQRHGQRAEHWIVVSGTALVTRGDDTFPLHENQSTFIPVNTVHRLSNPGERTLELIEVQSGAYLGEDDIERLDDVYRRAP